MSRINAPAKNGGSLAYGLDHALGFWASLEDAKGDEVADVQMYGFANLTDRWGVVQFVRDNIAPDALPLHEARIEYMMLDLDPALAP
jgi:hypothetical protein